MEATYDFGGWATKNNLRCSDGRTIMKDAFKDNHGKKVPLVWNHQHGEVTNVLGHAWLENRDEGVYAYCKFNSTPNGQYAKSLVEDGDIDKLSIFANQLRQQQGNVHHGQIREVSLVLAGANPGAYIDYVRDEMRHGDEPNDDSATEARISTGDHITLFHSDSNPAEPEETEEEDETETEEVEETKETTEPEETEETVSHSDETKEEKPMANEKTIKEIFDSMTEEQQNLVYALVGQAVEDATNGNSEGGDANMKHNIFDQETGNSNDVLIHAEEMAAIVSDAKRYGSLKDSFLAHGIEHIDYLFPDYQELNKTPEFIKRDTTWVAGVMNSVHHTPFSRIKTTQADITEDEARARGYMKGGLKKDEVFTLLKRTTDPQTIYKKQKLDRDDVIDIRDLDVIAWLKTEMRMMLDEEIARAILVGDGRMNDSDDKIKEQHIRPIWTDDDLYSVKAVMEVQSTDDADARAKKFIRTVIKNRKFYKGSGEPTLYTTEDILTDCLLMEDATGRTIYDTVDKLATALRVKKIVTVPVMEGLSRTKDGQTLNLMCIMVNLTDYNIGADKGGEINMFDDFDIDFNQQKYLIETRCSGALTKVHSALVVEMKEVAAG